MVHNIFMVYPYIIISGPLYNIVHSVPGQVECIRDVVIFNTKICCIVIRIAK